MAETIVGKVNELLLRGESVVLFVDDAESLDDPTRALERLLASRPHGLNVVIAGRADAIRSAYGHWTAQVRRSRMGIALRPNLDADGDIFGLALPRRLGPFPPGRGCLIRDGDVEVIQVPHG